MDTMQRDPSVINALTEVPEEFLDQLREDSYLENLRQLKLDLAHKSDECELLKIQLAESCHNVEQLSQELNECKLTIFENNEDSKRTHEEVMKSKKLEEDYVKAMSDLVDLSERNDQCRLNYLDKFISKSNAINNYECLMTSGAFKAELDDCKLELDDKTVELNLALAKIKNLEEDNATKDKSINELKKSLDDAKVTHKHEITVLEEYIQCLKNTISSYEKTLTTDRAFEWVEDANEKSDITNVEVNQAST